MNNTNILKAVQCLIGSNCLVSTPDAFYVGPKGYDSKMDIENAVKRNSEDIETIKSELHNKINGEELKTINGVPIIGKGNISITTESGVVDLSPYLTIEGASLQYSTKENSAKQAASALTSSKEYTDNRIANLDPQHILITDNYKEFSKESNVGRLLYVTKETPIAYRFRTNTGYSIYTKVYTAPGKDDTINNVIAYLDKFLINEYLPSENGFGDLVFTDYTPDYLTPYSGIDKMPYVQTEVITEGLYYLPSVNNPVLLSSDLLVAKILDSINTDTAYSTLINKTLLHYTTGSIQLSYLTNNDIYEVVYDNSYLGIYYKTIAYLIKMGNRVFVWGTVRVDKYGVVYIDPYSSTSSWYLNIYSNRWEKMNDPEISSIKETVNNHIQSSNDQIEGIRSTMPRYYIINTIAELEVLEDKIGDTIEVNQITVPQHYYHVWKSSKGELLYSDNFSLNNPGTAEVTVYTDRNFGNTVVSGWNYETDEVGKHILNDNYLNATKFYYVKTIDSSVNDNLIRKVSIRTSVGYRKIAELF